VKSGTRALVYIAGPYTGDGSKEDTERNVAAAIAAGDILLNAGMAPFVPHLSHYWEARFPHPYDVWMDYCLSWVDACDALVRLPGESKGAAREVERAVQNVMPVFPSAKECVTWWYSATGPLVAKKKP